MQRAARRPRSLASPTARRRRLGAWLLATGVLVAACGTEDDPAVTTGGAMVETTRSTPPTSPPPRPPTTSGPSVPTPTLTLDPTVARFAAWVAERDVDGALAPVMACLDLERAVAVLAPGEVPIPDRPLGGDARPVELEAAQLTQHVAEECGVDVTIAVEAPEQLGADPACTGLGVCFLRP